MVFIGKNKNLKFKKTSNQINIRSIPNCFQDKNTFKLKRFTCIICDFFDECKELK